MKHLTVDEIIEFILSDALSEESREIVAAVSSHIRSCDECLNELRDYQKVYDELVEMGAAWAFGMLAEELVKKNRSKDRLRK